MTSPHRGPKKQQTQPDVLDPGWYCERYRPGALAVSSLPQCPGSDIGGSSEFVGAARPRPPCQPSMPGAKPAALAGERNAARRNAKCRRSASVKSFRCSRDGDGAFGAEQAVLPRCGELSGPDGCPHPQLAWARFACCGDRWRLRESLKTGACHVGYSTMRAGANRSSDSPPCGFAQEYGDGTWRLWRALDI
jgi:hypothetical protein